MTGLSYQVELLSRARRQLRKFDRGTAARLIDAVTALGADPRPPGAKILKSGAGLMRLRVGHYRIVYRVDDARLTVVVVTLGHRREVYDEL